MAGFPRLPLVHGDTDDDASIHLHRQIGPSRPITRPPPSDHKILDIAHDDSVDDLDTDNINQYFELYRRNELRLSESDGDEDDDGSYRPDSDSDTYNETSEDDYDDEIHHNEKDRPYAGYSNGPEPEHQPIEHEWPAPPAEDTIPDNSAPARPNDHWVVIFGTLLLLSCLALLAVASILDTRAPTTTTTAGDLSAVDTTLSRLTETVSGLSVRQDFLEANHESLAQNINSRFESLAQKFHTLEQTSLSRNSRFESLAQEFDSLRSSINSTVDQTRLDAINAKLAKFHDLNSDVESLKAHILDELMSSLPQHVPVYIKNKRIHFIPEFHKYLYNFIENYSQNRTGASNPSWAQFLEANQGSLDAYLEKKVGLNGVQQLTKEKLDKIIRQKFEENNQHIFGKINEVIDRLDVVGSTNTTAAHAHFNRASSTILLNTLLETFSKGAIKVNYADYTLGARILGFLTTLSADNAASGKSLARRVFFGWYDYLTSNNGGVLLRARAHWKYNANNVLLDNEQAWECRSHHCTLGVRLFSPVILTDLVLSHRPADTTGAAAPRIVSVYVKPRSPDHAARLRDHLQRYHLDAGTAPALPTNQYLAKFVKIKDARVGSAGSFTHIRIPVSIVNLRIPVRDIYVELQAPRDMVAGLTTFKAYGITELHAYKYADQFDTLVGSLQEEDPDSDSHLHHDSDAIEIHDPWDDVVLGDDQQW